MPYFYWEGAVAVSFSIMILRFFHTAMCILFIGGQHPTCYLLMDIWVVFSFWAVFHFWQLGIKLLGILV